MAKTLLDFVVFRAFREGDYNFLLSSWAKSFKGSPWAGVVPNSHWHALMKETVDQLLARGAQVVMAVADDNDDQILGYICYEKAASGVPVVHYVFVKEEFRSTEGERHGIGSALLALTGDSFFIYTFKTPDSRHLSRRGKHVPAIARRKDLEPVYPCKSS